jgi:hypothetical protein
LSYSKKETALLLTLFDGRKQFEKLPFIDTSKSEIKGVVINEEMSHPIMRSIDSLGRDTFTIRAKNISDECLSKKQICQTFYRKTEDSSTWTSHSTGLPIIIVHGNMIEYGKPQSPYTSRIHTDSRTVEEVRDCYQELSTLMKEKHITNYSVENKQIIENNFILE